MSTRASWKKLTSEEELDLASRIRSLEADLEEVLLSIPTARAVLEQRSRRRETTACQRVDRIRDAVRSVQTMRPRPLNAIAISAKWCSSDEMRWRLAMSGYRIAVGEARKLGGRGLPHEDLVNEGIIGLLDAAKRFDAARKLRFSTYARWWVRARMMRAIDTTGSAIRLPGGLLERLRRLKMISDRIGRDGIAASESELAEIVGCDIQEVRELFQAFDVTQTVSLSVPVADQSSSKVRTLEDVVQDDKALNPERVAMVGQMRDLVRDTLGDFASQQHRDVIASYVGLESSPSTLQEAGDRVGISRERVRQLVLLLERRVMQRIEPGSGSEEDAPPEIRRRLLSIGGRH